MTAVTQLVSEAFRTSGITAIGASPTAAEQAEGVRRLAALVSSIIGNELGENIPTLNYGSFNLVTDEAVDEDVSSLINSTYIPQNSRVIFNNSGAKTLYLDPAPADGARLQVIDNAGNFATSNVTLNGNGRKIESAASVTLNTNSLNREWFYRQDLGEWIRYTELTSSDNSPFPDKYDDYLVLLLALRINPSFGASITPEHAAFIQRAERQFRAQYSQGRQMSVDNSLAKIGPYGVLQRTFRF